MQLHEAIKTKSMERSQNSLLENMRSNRISATGMKISYQDEGKLKADSVLVQMDTLDEMERQDNMNPQMNSREI